VIDLIRDYEAMLAQERAAPTYTNLMSFPSGLGGESQEDKIDRLDGYIAHLQLVDDSLKMTYKVSLRLKSNKPDSNVAIKTESTAAAYIFESESYISDLVPRTEPPSITGVSYGRMGEIELGDIPSIVNHTSNSPYATSEEETNLPMVNANATYNLYDSDLFVHTDQNVVDLKITVHSTKLESPQEIVVPVDFSNVTASQVSR
jgi:hypothetical protein